MRAFCYNVRHHGLPVMLMTVTWSHTVPPRYNTRGKSTLNGMPKVPGNSMPPSLGFARSKRFVGVFRVGDTVLQRADSLKALGTELPLRPNTTIPLVKIRIAAAMQMAERLSLLRLPILLGQQLVRSIVLPCSVYPLVPHTPNVRQLQQLGGAIERNMRICGTRVSWHPLRACVWKAHQVDPRVVQTYQHLRSVSLARRSSGDLDLFWRDRPPKQPRSPQNGPIHVWEDILRELGVTEAPNGVLTHARTLPVDLFRDEWTWIKNFWIQTLRWLLLQEVRQRRPQFGGVGQDTDLDGVKILARTNHPCGSELISLPCDGLWTQRVQAKMDGSEDAKC